MIDILAAFIIWISGPIPLTEAGYTCTTDYECTQECIARGESHCDDMMYGVGANDAK